jgi:hypothetical protein
MEWDKYFVQVTTCPNQIDEAQSSRRSMTAFMRRVTKQGHPMGPHIPMRTGIFSSG